MKWSELKKLPDDHKRERRRITAKHISDRIKHKKELEDEKKSAANPEINQETENKEK